MGEGDKKVLSELYLNDFYKNLDDFEKMLKNIRKYNSNDFDNLKENYLTLMRACINRLNGIFYKNSTTNPAFRLCKTLLYELELHLENLDSYEVPLSNKLNKVIPETRKDLGRLSKIFPTL